MQSKRRNASLTAETVMIADNDCEDQGYSLLSDGCLRWECQMWEPGKDRPTHPQLVKRGGFWVCPKCGGSYGEIPMRRSMVAGLDNSGGEKQ